MKRYSTEKILEILRKIFFPNYLTYTCVHDAYLDFIYGFAIYKVYEDIKYTKAKLKPWFDNQIMSAILRRDKLV